MYDNHINIGSKSFAYLFKTVNQIVINLTVNAFSIMCVRTIEDKGLLKGVLIVIDVLFLQSKVFDFKVKSVKFFLSFLLIYFQRKSWAHLVLRMCSV